MLINTYPSGLKLCDPESRFRKATKIIRVLDDFLGRGSTQQMCCLEVGCYAGLITENLRPHFRTLVGLDLDGAAIRSAQGRNQKRHIKYLVGDGSRLPFVTASLDILICAQVYEHASGQARLFDELWRVLKPGGVCFFSGPNRLALIEEHYGLPCLSWLPRWLANRYVQATGRGDGYHEHPLTYWQLRRRLRRFYVRDYTIDMLRFPEQFACAEEIPGWSRAWLHRVPRVILGALIFLVPNYNWILVKEQNTRPSK